MHVGWCCFGGTIQPGSDLFFMQHNYRSLYLLIITIGGAKSSQSDREENELKVLKLDEFKFEEEIKWYILVKCLLENVAYVEGLKCRELLMVLIWMVIPFS